MTDREVLEVSETKIRLWSCESGRCEVCGRAISVTDAQLAHRIPQSRMNLRKYGKTYIHHPFNLAVTCADCNSRVIVHGTEEDALIERIRRDCSE